MLLGTLCASLLGNISAGKGINRVLMYRVQNIDEYSCTGTH